MAGLTALTNENNKGGEKAAVRVVSAAALKESQLSALENMLFEKLGKRAEIISEIDPSVIGGLLIFAEGRVIDGTVRKRLRDLKDRVKRRDAR